eukprot:TRINITY_DN3138_c0_g1_i1.p1 TRINITY_DN3138_c0_g1~~TRINITY_DN3138_c0_g1_i1.p1  ORF type:complete len:1070 (+),score=156.80 TRINITY_DN3138_c0_g1_i1:207-3212(+)
MNRLRNAPCGIPLLAICALLLVLLLLPLTVEAIPCPFDCYGSHGSCSPLGKCTCAAGWVGPSCRWPVTQLPSNATMQVDVGQWAYFTIQVPVTAPSLVVSVNWKGDSYPEVYVSKETNPLPSLRHYLYSSFAATSPNKVITIPYPSPGTWTIGVSTSNFASGFATGEISSFSIAYALEYKCPNQCHSDQKRGTCKKGVCECSGNYLPPDCSHAHAPIQFGEPLSSQVSTLNAFDYYTTPSTLQNFENTLLTFTLNIDSVTGEDLSLPTSTFALFVRKGALPTLVDYDYVLPHAHSSPLQVYMPGGVGDATWSVGVWGYDTFRYSIGVNLTKACVNDCHGQGECVQGVCQCHADYTPPYCADYRKQLQSDYVYSDSLQPDSHKFFVVESAKMDINFTLSDILAVHFEEEEEEEQVAPITVRIYTKFNSPPAMNDYWDYTECLIAPDDTRCSMILNSVSHGDWYFAPVLVTGPAISFHIQAIAADLCPNSCNQAQGHAFECASVGGACRCENNYNYSPDCSIFLHALTDINGVRSPEQLIEPDEWQYFSYLKATPATILSVNLTTSSPLTMYIRSNELPTDISYDGMLSHEQILPSVSGSTHQLLLLNGLLNIPHGSWYIGIHNPAELNVTASYQFRLLFTANCQNSNCDCKRPNRVGENCQSSYEPIEIAERTPGSIQPHAWSYYSIEITTPTVVAILLDDISAKVTPFSPLGQLWLFVRGDGLLPDLEKSDFWSTDLSTTQSVYIPSWRSTGNWSIGILPSPSFNGLVKPPHSIYNYSVVVLTGCMAYGSCSLCAADPLCGWCRTEWQDSQKGRCLQADDPTVGSCLVYQHDECDISELSQENFTNGLLISGVVAGGIGFLVVSAFILLLYRFRKQERDEYPPLIPQAPNSGQPGYGAHSRTPQKPPFSSFSNSLGLFHDSDPLLGLHEDEDDESERKRRFFAVYGSGGEHGPAGFDFSDASGLEASFSSDSSMRFTVNDEMTYSKHLPNSMFGPVSRRDD